MSQPEMERQLTQHRSDIDALYDLLEDFRQQTVTRFDGIDGRLDSMGGQLTSLATDVAEILRRLPG